MARIEAEIGPIDILVSNAGIQSRGPFETVTLKDWNLLLKTDLSREFVVGRAAGARMATRDQGQIIKACSMHSELGWPTIGPYMAAKGGGNRSVAPGTPPDQWEPSGPHSAPPPA